MILRNLLIAASVLVAGSSATALTPGIGDQVSDTTFTTAYGQKLSIGDLRGEVVVLTYWMTDCGVCAEQLRTLDYYYRQRPDVGLRVMAISVDPMSSQELRRAFKDKRVYALSKIDGPFDVPIALPTTYVIDRTGKLRYASSAPLGIEQLNQVLVPLIREPQP
jgi:cytochrome c biogenesis protein CcmG/thiol:disulfide interchange protein DsbE